MRRGYERAAISSYTEIRILILKQLLFMLWQLMQICADQTITSEPPDHSTWSPEARGLGNTSPGGQAISARCCPGSGNPTRKPSGLWPSNSYKCIQKVVLVTQSCLCDPIDCNPPGFSVRGILQARILEWAAIHFSTGPSRPRDRASVSYAAGKVFTI